MADNNTIARPYAQAVFELAKAAGELSAWSESLDIAGQFLDDDGLVEYLSTPALSDEKRLEFLGGLFKSASAAKLAGGDKLPTSSVPTVIVPADWLTNPANPASVPTSTLVIVGILAAIFMVMEP